MNPKTSNPGNDKAGRKAKLRNAFTLIEIMVSVSLFSILILGILNANILGVRWFNITETKLKASNSARTAISRISDEIRTCNSVYVGNLSNSVFVAHTSGESLIGNSLLIYATTNTTNFVLYFVNASDHTLRRTVNALGTTSIIAQTVTNVNLFDAEDCFGNVLTNTQNNYVIHCIIQYYTTNTLSRVADWYKLETSASPRSQD